MIVETSAVIAILRNESDAPQLERAVASAALPKISVASVLEASLVMGPTHQGELDSFLRDAVVESIPVSTDQLAIARAADLRFGKRSGSKARLNFGDCFSYALAKTLDEPLLFKGDDFNHTDVRSALAEAEETFGEEVADDAVN